MRLIIPILAAAGIASATIPLEDPLYRWLYHSETFGPLLHGSLPESHTIAFDPEAGPAWIWNMIHDRASGPVAQDKVFGMESMISGQLLSVDGKFESRAGTTLEFGLAPMKRFSIDQRLSVWTGSDTNPPSGFMPFHYGLEHGRHFYVDWGYVSADAGPLDISFGRIPVRWGPGRFTQLLISGEAPPLDMLKVDLQVCRCITFSGFTSTLDSDSNHTTWLSAHRLDIKPAENLRIGLSETMVYTSDGIDLAYANLIIPWYPVQWNERVDDNAFMAIDATWQPLRGLALYTELLIDDIQYNNVNNVPDKLGVTVGADAFFRRSGLGLNAEYTAIQRYVYGQRLPENFYLHDDRIIGSQLGPDADRVTAGVSWCGLPGVTATLTGNYTRNGEGDVYEGWPDTVQAGGPFPSGIIEETTLGTLNVGWYSRSWLELRGVAAYSSTKNTGHVSGHDTNDYLLSLQWTGRW